MKFEEEKNDAFKPVTVKLETQEEFDEVMIAFSCCAEGSILNKAHRILDDMRTISLLNQDNLSSLNIQKHLEDLKNRSPIPHMRIQYIERKLKQRKFRESHYPKMTPKEAFDKQMEKKFIDFKKKISQSIQDELKKMGR